MLHKNCRMLVLLAAIVFLRFVVGDDGTGDSKGSLPGRFLESGEGLSLPEAPGVLPTAAQQYLDRNLVMTWARPLARRWANVNANAIANAEATSNQLPPPTYSELVSDAIAVGRKQLGGPVSLSSSCVLEGSSAASIG